MLISAFNPRGAVPIICAVLLLSTLFIYRADLPIKFHLYQDPSDPSSPSAPAPSPVYREPAPSNPPVREIFPAAAQARDASDIPAIPSYNVHREWNEAKYGPAPLMIGFTRNWPVLQQAVVSYLAAGWPAHQIWVVENTGTMDSNKRNRLTLQNPFYIDYHRLTKVLGVNVLTTPTLFTFAQLQNYMMFTAIEKGWETYFWSHMDVVALSDEKFILDEHEEDNPNNGQYLSLFDRAIIQRRKLIERAKDPAAAFKWALHFFAYDRLTLVNLSAYMEVGGWDPMIGYYNGDCDFYERLRWGEYSMEASEAGLVADVGSTMPDLGVLYRRTGWTNDTDSPGERFGVEDERGGQGYDQLLAEVLGLQETKNTGGPGARNFWQSEQQGGQGEPFYRDSEGFERGIWYSIALGRKIFAEKWGHRDCDLVAQNLKPEDAWRVEHDGDWKFTIE